MNDKKQSGEKRKDVIKLRLFNFCSYLFGLCIWTVSLLCISRCTFQLFFLSLAVFFSYVSLVVSEWHKIAWMQRKRNGSLSLVLLTMQLMMVEKREKLQGHESILLLGKMLFLLLSFLLLYLANKDDWPFLEINL